MEECLRIEPRTYNSSQLSEKLNTERNVQLSPDRLRRVLKKRGSIGSEHFKSHKGNQDPIARASKQADLDILELSAAAGDIDLKYLDESFFLCMERTGLYLLL